jgi:putative PIN family toxin of toxin-antitoxin system
MKIVLDTNVYISAAILGRVCEEIIRLCRISKIETFISENIINEIKDKLIKKFYWKANQVEILIFNLLEFAIIVSINEKIKFIKNDPEDNKILECAVSSNSNLTVSGDKHLINLKSYRDIKILKPSEFLILLK